MMARKTQIMSQEKTVAATDGATRPVTKEDESKILFGVSSIGKERVPNPGEVDPFDPANLRIDQSYLDQPAAKRLLTTLPVRKPGKQDFVRVHPSPEYRITVALVELEEDRETYIIAPNCCDLFEEGEFHLAALYLTVNRQKTLRLWPIKLSLSGRANTWHTSAAEAAEKAMRHWIRVLPNQNLGAYEIFQSERDFGEPEWPQESLRELLSIAFKNRRIDRADHPVLQKLRGRI
jgi:hypothetical protein